MGMEINIDRLMTNLFEMAKIGMNEQGGNRPGAGKPGRLRDQTVAAFLLGKKF